MAWHGEAEGEEECGHYIAWKRRLPLAITFVSASQNEVEGGGGSVGDVAFVK